MGTLYFDDWDDEAGPPPENLPPVPRDGPRTNAKGTAMPEFITWVRNRTFNQDGNERGKYQFYGGPADGAVANGPLKPAIEVPFGDSQVAVYTRVPKKGYAFAKEYKEPDGPRRHRSRPRQAATPAPTCPAPGARGR